MLEAKHHDPGAQHRAEAQTTRTYAEAWAEAINETYTDDMCEFLVAVIRGEGEGDGNEDDDYDSTMLRVLTKAAQALRNGVPATFTGPELDLVRHAMPAHAVHQSGSLRWVADNFKTWRDLTEQLTREQIATLEEHERDARDGQYAVDLLLMARDLAERNKLA